MLEYALVLVYWISFMIYYFGMQKPQKSMDDEDGLIQV